jgi:hypothetical protein
MAGSAILGSGPLCAKSLGPFRLHMLKSTKTPAWCRPAPASIEVPQGSALASTALSKLSRPDIGTCR